MQEMQRCGIKNFATRADAGSNYGVEGMQLNRSGEFSVAQAREPKMCSTFCIENPRVIVVIHRAPRRESIEIRRKWLERVANASDFNFVEVRSKSML